jgi:iron complex transport system permease protein
MVSIVRSPARVRPSVVADVGISVTELCEQCSNNYLNVVQFSGICVNIVHIDSFIRGGCANKRGRAMKITLDISKLVEESQLTREEANKLTALAAHETGSLGINILIGLGVVATAAGGVALAPTPLTAVSIGLGLLPVGCAIVLNRLQQWILLGQICLVLGALMFGGGVIVYGAGSLASMLIVTVAFALAAVAARSGLLMALSVLVASACLGARTGYSHALYSVAIFEPTLTVVLFSGVALIAYQASKRLAANYERLAITAVHTSLLLVNLGFWIGSLWGDPLMLLRSMNAQNASVFMTKPIIPAAAFIIIWAIVLLGAGIWAVQVNRRWMVNLVAVFAGIHFYTQWFEHLGASPSSVLLGGLVMLATAVALWMFNRRFPGT